MYERIQPYLALRTEPLKNSDLLFATTSCVDGSGNVITAQGKPLSMRVQNRMWRRHYATIEIYVEEV